ncbi:MAG TPA: class I SAM-dependent rRNA methyltransferase [Thermoanaerobaculia bacterium]|nr:class I SAM-dependent rRNA methyltransferase [Thermoanaerobaculia bacterium]
MVSAEPAAATETIAVHLRAGPDKAIRDGHPWVFSGAVARVEGPADAPLARVFDAAGSALGLGFYSPRSQIRVRMLGGPAESSEPPLDALDLPDTLDTLDRLIAARLDEAAALRRAVVPPATTGYRLLNAEGDGIPGWTVDRFGDVLVSQITVAGLEGVRRHAYAALLRQAPGSAIFQANDLLARRAEGLPRADEVIAGAPPAEASFIESGFHFSADLAGGQKTGFYCDQRDNRRLVERLAGGRRVLDLFAHTGAFGCYALRGGASGITCVESSARLLDSGRRHLAANGLDRLDGSPVEWVRANVWEELRERTELYDMAVCDPPPLVRKRRDLEAAARAYKDLNRLALGRLRAGGLLLTFSCSGAVDAKLFRQILFAAAVEARVRVALLSQLGAAPDHPIAITHPQGEYLKGWLALVQGPAGRLAPGPPRAAPDAKAARRVQAVPPAGK